MEAAGEYSKVVENCCHNSVGDVEERDLVNIIISPAREGRPRLLLDTRDTDITSPTWPRRNLQSPSRHIHINDPILPRILLRSNYYNSTALKTVLVRYN